MADFSIEREVKAWNDVTSRSDTRSGSNNEAKGQMLHDEYCSMSNGDRAELFKHLEKWT